MCLCAAVTDARSEARDLSPDKRCMRAQPRIQEPISTAGAKESDPLVRSKSAAMPGPRTQNAISLCSFPSSC